MPKTIKLWAFPSPYRHIPIMKRDRVLHRFIFHRSLPEENLQGCGKIIHFTIINNNIYIREMYSILRTLSIQMIKIKCIQYKINKIIILIKFLI